MTRPGGQSDHSFQYWLVGLPGTSPQARKQCWDKVRALTKKLSENYRFPVPGLRVGTLDHLLTASVELERLEATVEGVLSKIIQGWTDVLDFKMNSIEEYFLINGVPIPEFLTRFKWELAKYPVRQTIKAIQDQIERVMGAIETEVKTLHTEYITARTDLAALERREKGPLLTRNVSEFVKKEDFVLQSEHLVTVLVVVAKMSYHEWYSNYERIDNEVVPRSTNLLFEDEDYGLFNVTLFKRHLNQFKEKAKQMRFFVKDFIFDKKRIDEERFHMEDLRQKKVTLIGPLLRALRINFSESYIAYVHVKTMRVFVECVLRYGLPAEFICIMMVVPKRNVKKLRDLMYKEFSYLDGSLPKEESKNANLSNDYFPYVSIKINVEPPDFK